MTNAELKRLYNITRKIEWLSERIEEISELSAQRITGMPHGGGTSDNTANLAIKLSELQRRLERAKTDAIAEYVRIVDYIEAIDDPIIRDIMTYRHIDCLSWDQVADCMGSGISAETCRVLHWRYLAEQEHP